MNDMVNHPKHYMLANGLESKDVVRAILTEEYIGWCKGNALKYQFRAGKKDPNKTEEDYKKAIWFLKEMIGILSENGGGIRSGEKELRDYKENFRSYSNEGGNVYMNFKDEN